MSVFYLENCLLISGISGFSFFAIENIQNLETTKNFQKLIFRGIKSIYLIFEPFSKHFLCSWQNSQGVAQSYQEALTIKAWNWLFLLSKPKWYVDNELIVFQQFSNNIKVFTLGPLDLESFLLISGISGFSFFAIEHIRKPGNHGKFS